MLKLLKKDITLFFNDQRSYILTFLIPVILITLFAFAYGALGQSESGPESFDLIVTDMDNSILSEQYILLLDSINGMDITLTDFSKATDLITKGKFSAGLVLHKGFMDSLLTGRTIPLELLYDKDQNMEAGLMQSVILNVLFSFSRSVESQNQSFLEVQSGVSALDYALYSSDRVKDSGPVLKMTSIVGENNDLNLGLIQAVSGTAILMLLFSVAAIGTSILEEKENGTIKRLLYSPLSLRTILFSKMLFAFLVSIMQLTVMFIYSWIFLKLDITVNIKALVLMILSTSFAVSSLGIFLAALAKSRQQAQSLSTLVILVMSAIGGSMIPLFIMPQIMHKIAVLSINYWSIQGFYDIFWRSLPLSEILPEILVLTAAGIVFTIFSIRLFSKNIFSIIQ
ncbi:MAG: ABC transporter permease [Bacteroidales bacterium]|nr:ABC transporter permease [Bacteroidales bacterium]